MNSANSSAAWPTSALSTSPARSHDSSPLDEGADRLMLRCARQMVRKQGWSCLRIRELVSRAGVNLGMFHYHFRSKENFKKIVMREMYEEFFDRFIVASRTGHDPLRQLKNSLLTLGLTVRDERVMIFSLLKDVMGEDSEVIELLRLVVRRHISVIERLVQECQDQGKIARVPFAQVLSFLMTSMNIPTLLGAAMERPSFPLSRNRSRQFCKSILTDEAIAQRIDFALKGLKP